MDEIYAFSRRGVLTGKNNNASFEAWYETMITYLDAKNDTCHTTKILPAAKGF